MAAKREVGADIQNKCQKCGDGAHVIMSITNGRIGKVECAQCGSQHRHRLTDAEKQMKPAKRTFATAGNLPESVQISCDVLEKFFHVRLQLA